MYLHCGKCGKRVYGRENVDALLKDQRRAWEGDEELQAEIRRRKAEEARKKLEEARAERLQAEHLEKRRIEEEQRKAEEARKQEEAHQRWVAKQEAQARLKRERAKVEAEAAKLAVVEECAWVECSNPRRPNSIYCCRKCSNKNAHWRAKQRRLAEHEQARIAM